MPSTVNQIVGGQFQDTEGNILSNGFLLFELSQDGVVNINTKVCAGYKILVPLNSSGSVAISPVQNFWPNDVLNPSVNPIPVSPVTTKLGEAAYYVLLGNSGVSNTGTTLITGGNVGSFPTTSITGLTGTNFVPPAAIDNTNASAAQTALAAAITYYQGLTPTLSGVNNLSVEGNGSTASTWTPGNYFGSSSLSAPSGVILDALGNPDAQFVFVAGSTINLASGQSIALVNGARAENVVFVAGSSFTSVATSTVNGNILAVTSVSIGGGTLNGRALANTGAVTIAAATAITSPIPQPGSETTGTYYTVTAYSSTGQLVWGPNPQSVLHTPSPFDLGAWIPGKV